MYSASTGARKYRRPKRYSHFQAVFIKSPNGIPHSPPQKSGLYISGGFRDIGAFTPNVALSPNSNRTRPKRTTASPPITPAAKQIATRCASVKPFSITFKTLLLNYTARKSAGPPGKPIAVKKSLRIDIKGDFDILWTWHGNRESSLREPFIM